MTPQEQELHRQLHELPDIAAPAALETRILHARRKQLRRNGSVLAGLCLSCASLAFAPLLLRSPEPPEPTAQTATAAATTTGNDAVDLQVLAIDQALQAAYDSNARSEEIASLWMARERLVATGLPPSGSI